MIFHDGISEIEIEGTSGETGRVRTQVSHHLPRPQTKGRLTGPLCSFFIASSILSGATGIEKIAGMTLKLSRQRCLTPSIRGFLMLTLQECNMEQKSPSRVQ